MSTTLIITIGGTLTPGDLLMLSVYSPSPRGEGRGTLKYRVKPAIDTVVTDPSTGAKSIQSTADTIENIVDVFIDFFWTNSFEWQHAAFEIAKRSSDSFVIKQINSEGNFANFRFQAHGESINGDPITEIIGMEIL